MATKANAKTKPMDKIGKRNSFKVSPKVLSASAGFIFKIMIETMAESKMAVPTAPSKFNLYTAS